MHVQKSYRANQSLSEIDIYGSNFSSLLRKVWEILSSGNLSTLFSACFTSFPATTANTFSVAHWGAGFSFYHLFSIQWAMVHIAHSGLKSRNRCCSCIFHWADLSCKPRQWLIKLANSFVRRFVMCPTFCYHAAVHISALQLQVASPRTWQMWQLLEYFTLSAEVICSVFPNELMQLWFKFF